MPHSLVPDNGARDAHDDNDGEQTLADADQTLADIDQTSAEFARELEFARAASPSPPPDAEGAEASDETAA